MKVVHQKLHVVEMENKIKVNEILGLTNKSQLQNKQSQSLDNMFLVLGGNRNVYPSQNLLSRSHSNEFKNDNE